MTKYEVPVIWQECGSLLIEAETPEEAVKIALAEETSLPNEDQSYYVEESAEVDEAFLDDPDNYIHNASPIEQLREKAKKDPEVRRRLDQFVKDRFSEVGLDLDLDKNIEAALEDEGDSI